MFLPYIPVRFINERQEEYPLLQPPPLFLLFTYTHPNGPDTPSSSHYSPHNLDLLGVSYLFPLPSEISINKSILSIYLCVSYRRRKEYRGGGGKRGFRGRVGLWERSGGAMTAVQELLYAILSLWRWQYKLSFSVISPLVHPGGRDFRKKKDKIKINHVRKTREREFYRKY